MKKIKILIMSFTIILVMFFNIRMNDNANVQNNLTLENITALACFSVENENGPLGECCWPYWETCIVLDLWTTIQGDWNPGI